MVLTGAHMLRGSEVFARDKHLEVLYASSSDLNLLKPKVYNVCCV